MVRSWLTPIVFVADDNMTQTDSCFPVRAVHPSLLGPARQILKHKLPETNTIVVAAVHWYVILAQRTESPYL